jgi:hypothetical protein
MNIVDVQYSLVDINERFDHLVLDFLYIRNLGMTIKSCFNRIFSIGEQIHDRIGEKKFYLLKSTNETIRFWK